jgi:cell wall-associated NlpC family hydrolase
MLFMISCKDRSHVTLIESPAINRIDSKTTIDSTITIVALPDPVIYKPGMKINTGSIIPDSIVSYGKSLVGTPYLYASSDPAKGFDCSGFITYVFNHFGIAVPRSSVDFTNVGSEIPRDMAGPGDLILFTGTDSTIKVIGHMGIVESNEHGNLLFLHSTSGKAYGVTISPLQGYYETRFVKVIRIFPQMYFAVP